MSSAATGNNLEGKYADKQALRERLWLRDEFKPIVAYVGRLDCQKGVDLVRHAIFYALAHGAQFVLLGNCPDPVISERFWGLKHDLNDDPDCHLELGYHQELGHLVYAGSDLIVVPSLFEPCGLTQLIAMKYGTVPVVRHTGASSTPFSTGSTPGDRPRSATASSFTSRTSPGWSPR